MRLYTPRLALIAATPDHLLAELTALKDPPAQVADHPLAVLVDVSMPEYWPPDLFEADDMARSLEKLDACPSETGWGMWYLVESGRLIGIAGLDGPPVSGSVALGYSLLPSARNRGLATEATRALVEWAFRDARVSRIVAETFPDLKPSVRVLEKSGFVRAREARTPGAIAYEIRREMVRAVGLEPT